MSSFLVIQKEIALLGGLFLTIVSKGLITEYPKRKASWKGGAILNDRSESTI